MKHIYLANYDNCSKYPLPGKPGPDMFLNVTKETEDFARKKGWISDGPLIVDHLITYNPKQNPFEVRLERNPDGSRSPAISYKNRKLSPVQTKICTLDPESLYRFLAEIGKKAYNPYSPDAEDIQDMYFEPAILKPEAIMSPIDWYARIGKMMRKVADTVHRKNTKRHIGYIHTL